MRQKNLWIDTRLSQEEMDFLWESISDAESNGSELIKDKDNWFYENVLKKHTERLFYDDWDNYRKYHIVGDESPPEFEMHRFWVNYQKQHEFNPLHSHSPCLYSFVIFMKIPTHWKEQHEMNKNEFRAQVASDFMFVWGSENMECMTRNFSLSPEDEGRMLFFPAWLQHQVYPFYGTEEKRITISGNTVFVEGGNPTVKEKKEGVVMLYGDEYEDKEKILKMLEESIKVTKEELEQMKKAGKKV